MPLVYIFLVRWSMTLLAHLIPEEQLKFVLIMMLIRAITVHSRCYQQQQSSDSA